MSLQGFLRSAAVLAATIALASPALATQPGDGASTQTTATVSDRTDAVSTGVGNAGSFGIGSGTADSLSEGKSWGEGKATATATSDGYHSTTTATFSGPVTSQELAMSVTNTQLTVHTQHTGNGAAGDVNLQTNAGVFSGVQTLSITTSPLSKSQAATAIAANVNMPK